MPRVLITGGTGLVGRALSKALLQKKYEVVILTRGQASGKKSLETGEHLAGLSNANWNIPAKTIDHEAISSADYIVHLAGAGIADKRWTKKRKLEIVESRVKSSKLIIESLKKIPNKVKAVVSASGIGWYSMEGIPEKERDQYKFVESDPAGQDFLSQTCKQWEESIEPVTSLGKRLVKLRTGIALSKEGGALKEFLKPLKFGMGTILGSGKQIVSWIHIDDLVSCYIAAIENEKMNGAYNAVAPDPVSNKELIIHLARIKKGRAFMPIKVPPFILKLVLGEMSTEVLKSSSVSSRKLIKEGFEFRFPQIEAALKNLIVR